MKFKHLENQFNEIKVISIMTMKKILLLVMGTMLLLTQGLAQKKMVNKTDVSLFYKKDKIQIKEVISPTGDLYQKLGHHGPAIENEYMAIRLYFSQKTAIDIYSKSKKGLELARTKWYPTEEQQQKGWGADYYKVGNTVGLGGVKLWDEGQLVDLNPVDMRIARVKKEIHSSYMEMISEGVPYQGRKIDVLVRVTVFSGVRKAKVEAFALGELPVQFATGINYHSKTNTQCGENFIAVWGEHPEDVAVEKTAVGGGITFQPADFMEKIDDGKQILLISKTGKYMEAWITSACGREKGISDLESFIESCINSEGKKM
ncbi:DUF4861 family protein [Persicobacter diffluens]|uniref:DUF4861 domain-containing protein n=1 Tax=Persicobacter diffluens TaxID=981 RepID=A0AAN4W4Q7_9BACT|nr:hypothetical protein PEDI_47990 [Persicobacter diffluens]